MARSALYETDFYAWAKEASCPWSFGEMMDAGFWPDSE